MRCKSISLGLLAATVALSVQVEVAQAATKVSDVDGKAVIHHYAAIAHAVFADALISARQLEAANAALLKAPTEANLQVARKAWLASRVPYMQSEVFRFGNAVVDDWEGQLNAWPLDEGLIDYVAKDYQQALGNPGATANIIANTQLKVGEETLDLSKITPTVLASLNEVGGSEANVATGYHAIEFLLWGQDLNGTNPGAGKRPASDFALDAKQCTGGHCDRRRDYLTAATTLLVQDLEAMEKEWQPGRADNYRAKLTAESVEQGLRKMLFGMGSLSLGELAGERMKVALEANSPEDEHDCFSDNTHNSHFYNAKGVRNIYLGEYRRIDGKVINGPSLSSLVAKTDAQIDREVRAQLATTEQALQQLVDSANAGVHFDQLIATGNKSGNALVHGGINALVTQTAGIEAAAKVLGISDLNPDTADHSF